MDLEDTHIYSPKKPRARAHTCKKDTIAVPNMTAIKSNTYTHFVLWFSPFKF